MLRTVETKPGHFYRDLNAHFKVLHRIPLQGVCMFHESTVNVCGCFMREVIVEHVYQAQAPGSVV